MKLDINPMHIKAVLMIASVIIGMMLAAVVVVLAAAGVVKLAGLA